MFPPFEPLRERLLSAGVPPSRVRRYLRELADHYEDLLAEEEESGKQGGIARAAAFARLGGIDDLAAAMTSQSRFRSLAARAPWAFFPGGAILGLAAGYGLTTLLMIGAVEGFARHVEQHLMPPAWLPPVADAIFGFDRYFLPIVLGWGLGVLAIRQRLRARWPVMAMMCVALLGAALYCRADWPSAPSTWRFHVGSLLDDLADPPSVVGYAAQVFASFSAALLPYLALRRRLRAGLAGLALAGLLTGCTSGPPPADEILRHLAARHGDGQEIGVVAATPEDGAALDQAAAEIRGHAAAAPPQPKSSDPEGVFQVSVTAAHSMAGNWKMVAPTRLTVRSGAPDSYGKVSVFLCRLDQEGDDLEGSCLPFRKHMRGTLRGDEVRLSWQAGIVSAEIRGRLLTPSDFAGTYAFGTLGIGLMGTDIPAYGSKISTSSSPADGLDDLATTLVADLAKGDLSSDRYAAALRRTAAEEPPLPHGEMAKLGAVRSVSFLGAVEKPVGDADAEKTVTMAVYDVEFVRGWKLCGFTRDADGRIDNAECR
jgi:hypothetical protein